MKYLMPIWAIVPLFLGLCLDCHAQQNCKVLSEQYAENYQGDCKKGMAHGKGTAKGKGGSYEGSFKKGRPHGSGISIDTNGNHFDGEWKAGLKDGKGKLTIKTNAGDSIVSGFWDKDEYIGKLEVPFRVINKSTNVGSVKINRTRSQENLISFKFTKRSKVLKILSFNQVNNFGGIEKTTDFEKVIRTDNTYPKRIRVQFTVSTDMVRSMGGGTGGYAGELDVELQIQGNWEIVVDILDTAN